ncbi:MAG: bifunctional riboflavin kinase/FAD synthetase [Rhizobiales bacterium]|nr:bifunctional riboflavin kinase/FAD synthetase [Hyphomicrobiales bacterium]
MPPKALTAHDPDDIPPELTSGVVAIGNFDGVHRGHAVLLERTLAEARRRGVPAVVLSFEPHPRTFFQPQRPVFRLTSVREKAQRLARVGIDGLVVAPFDLALAGASPARFAEEMLAARLKAQAVVVGPDFRYGARRAGSIETLKADGERLGFDVVVVPIVMEGEARASSTLVREALAEGNVERAGVLLGHPWFVTGTVIHGDRRGRDLGFPTANIALGPDCRLRHGVYVVTLTRADGTVHEGVASYGRRPTFDNGAPLLETFVLDFSGDLYGEEVTVTLLAWRRPELRFDSFEREDVAAARTYFSAHPPAV